MKLLFTRYLLQLLVCVFFGNIPELKAKEEHVPDRDSIQKTETYFNLLDTTSGKPLVTVGLDAFDLLFDVGQNKKILKSKTYRTALAKELIEEDKIREFVAIDSYIFNQTGLNGDLLQVLEEASRLASKLSDNNKKFFYLCLIDASIAGLKTFVSDQMLWYASAYRHHTLIEENAEEFNQSKLIALVSHAMTLDLADKREVAKERFLHGVSHIDHDNVREDDYYLLFKYVNFLLKDKAYDEVEKWLRYSLSLAHKHDDEYYKALSYYHLMLLKTKQGVPDMSKEYQREYQESKKKLNVKNFVKLTFIEESYYEVTNSMLNEDSHGLMIFLILLGLVFVGALGALAYVSYNTKRTKRNLIILANEKRLVAESQSEISKEEDMKRELVARQEPVSSEDINYLKNLAENNDPLFMKKFKEYFVDFTDCLEKNSETALNSAELEVCAFTKLGYTTKEVAYYRGDSIRSVENRKYRIRRKLNLPSDTDFTDWFMNV